MPPCCESGVAGRDRCSQPEHAVLVGGEENYEQDATRCRTSADQQASPALRVVVPRGTNDPRWRARLVDLVDRETVLAPLLANHPWRVPDLVDGDHSTSLGLAGGPAVRGAGSRRRRAEPRRGSARDGGDPLMVPVKSSRAQQKPAMPFQAASAGAAPSRWNVASISPYGRSAA